MNRPDSKNLSPLDRRWWTPARVLCIGLLLLVAGYIYARPTLEGWLGMELPRLVAQAGDEANLPNEAPRDDSPSPIDWSYESLDFPLEQIDRETWRSPAGLIYAHGSREGTRLKHVARHTTDDLSRPVHGVFDAATPDELLELLDEAWQLAQADPGQARPPDERGRVEWTVTMPREIGYVGGQQGQRQDRPRTRRIKLILEDTRVITAYPDWPR